MTSEQAFQIVMGLIALLSATLLPYLAIRWERKKHSGQVGTTEATTLWNVAAAQREIDAKQREVEAARVTRAELREEALLLRLAAMELNVRERDAREARTAAERASVALGIQDISYGLDEMEARFKELPDEYSDTLSTTLHHLQRRATYILKTLGVDPMVVTAQKIELPKLPTEPEVKES